MTEREWLTSEDPQAMLALFRRTDAYPVQPPFPVLSERRLRLFACALEPMFEGSSYDDVDDWHTELQVFMQPEVTLHVSDLAVQAALLREIVGNPFRPLTLPGRCLCRRCAPPGGQHHNGPCRAPWRTADVTALARAAYDERQADGTLDPARLKILADALEEAGCAVPRQEATILIFASPGGHRFDVVASSGGGDQETLHSAGRLRDAVRWAKKECAARGWHNWPPLDHRPGEKPRMMASGVLPVRPHPIVEHLRSPGPHCRGCWALDLLLGRS